MESRIGRRGVGDAAGCLSVGGGDRGGGSVNMHLASLRLDARIYWRGNLGTTVGYRDFNVDEVLLRARDEVYSPNARCHRSS